MTDTYGMTSDLGISFQNSYGTALANSIFWVPFMSEDIGVTKEPLIEENMTGRFDEGKHHEGLNAVPGELECEAHPISLGVLLKATLGDPTTVQSGNLYTHTFKPRTSDFDRYAAGRPVTITKHLGDAGSAHRYYDLVGSKLSMSVANGELFKASVEFVGGKYTQLSEPAASYPTGDPFAWSVASVSIGGSANSDVRELNIELDNALEGKHTLNNAKTPSRVKRAGRRTLAIGGTLVFDTQDEYQQFISQSERNLTLHLVGAADITSGYNEGLTVIVPLLRYVEFKPVAGGPGAIEVSISGKGVYSVTSATALQVTLVNTQTGY